MALYDVHFLKGAGVLHNTDPADSCDWNERGYVSHWPVVCVSEPGIKTQGYGPCICHNRVTALHCSVRPNSVFLTTPLITGMDPRIWLCGTFFPPSLPFLPLFRRSMVKKGTDICSESESMQSCPGLVGLRSSHACFAGVCVCLWDISICEELKEDAMENVCNYNT